MIYESCETCPLIYSGKCQTCPMHIKELAEYRRKTEGKVERMVNVIWFGNKKIKYSQVKE